MTRAKLSLWVCWATSLPLLGGCPPGTSTYQSQQNINLSVAPTGVGSLTVSWTDGAISIRVDPTATAITATGTVTATALSQAAADDLIAQVPVRLAVVESNPKQILLLLSAPTGLLESVAADVEVVIPAGLALSIKSGTSDVTVTGNTDTVSVTVDSGWVRVLDQTGNTRIRSTTGLVDVNSQAGDVDVRSRNGNIAVLARPDLGGSVRVSAQIGVVSIAVPRTFGAALDLTSRPLLGRVDANLDGFSVANLSVQAYAVSATLNGGGGEIVGECQVGNVYFRALTSTP